jgi:hypothetical protein
MKLRWPWVKRTKLDAAKVAQLEAETALFKKHVALVDALLEVRDLQQVLPIFRPPIQCLAASPEDSDGVSVALEPPKLDAMWLEISPMAVGVHVHKRPANEHEYEIIATEMLRRAVPELLNETVRALIQGFRAVPNEKV